MDLLLRTVKGYNAKADLKAIQRAAQFAEVAHAGQKRKSGEDFIEHPIAVSQVLAELGLDTTTLEASLLHDVVEDTDVTLEELREGFGDEVAGIVDGLTKLEKIEFKSREQEQAENVRKMIVAMAGDIRVLLIKLADRLHNMRTLEVLRQDQRRGSPPRPSRSTRRSLIASACSRSSGRWRICRSRPSTPAVPRDREPGREAPGSERQEYVDGLLEAARLRLREAGLKAEVDGRSKHLYSIYEKMVIGGKEFNEIYDLAGVRVVVDSIRDSYAALGAVHSLWKPVPGRFKDYVAMPKSNMYQSLHTTVVGPGGRPLEIQIRTKEMHRTAEFGIAAHWRYKEGKEGKKAKEASDLAWLGQMLDWLKDMADPREFMEGLKIDLYGGQVSSSRRRAT